MDFASVLDELMGKERDVPLSQRSGRTLSFSDQEVCKFQLCGLCPNRLFKNTKSDLGTCQFEFHDDHIEWEQVQKDWDKLDEREKSSYGYERDLCRLLDSLIREMDRKIQKAQERAALDNTPKDLKPEDQARLDDIKNKEKESSEKAEQLAEEGDIDGSMIFTQQAQTLKTQYDALHKQLTYGDKTIDVCTVCGVFINSTDNEQRRQDHLNGKQYQGWKKIREMYKQLSEALDKRREKEIAESDNRRRRRDSSRDRIEEGERERSLSDSSRRRRRSISPRDQKRRDDSPRRRGDDYYGGYSYDRREHDRRAYRDRRDYDRRDYVDRWKFDKRYYGGRRDLEKRDYDRRDMRRMR